MPKYTSDPEGRIHKIESVIAKRQPDLGLILENVHDPHNIGAILRTCDSVGICDVHIIYTEHTKNTMQYAGRRTASGAKKWVDVHFYSSLNEAMCIIKKKYRIVLGTHLGQESLPLYEYDLTQNMAIMMGNERSGLSEEALEYIDHNICIPQMGMVTSLNVSVATAVILYEAMRQKLIAGHYNGEFDLGNTYQASLAEKYAHNQHYRKKHKRIDLSKKYKP